MSALAPARAPAARPQIEPPGSAPPDAAAAPSNGVAAPVGGSPKMTLGTWLLLSRAARQPPARAAGDRAAGRRGGPEQRGRRASRGLAKNDIRALAPALARRPPGRRSGRRGPRRRTPRRPRATGSPRQSGARQK